MNQFFPVSVIPVRCHNEGTGKYFSFFKCYIWIICITFLFLVKLFFFWKRNY